MYVMQNTIHLWIFNKQYLTKNLQNKIFYIIWINYFIFKKKKKQRAYVIKLVKIR